MIANELNGIICNRNLYISRKDMPQNRRVINCHVKDGQLVVEDLYGGELYPVFGSCYQFADGSGNEVCP